VETVASFPAILKSIQCEKNDDSLDFDDAVKLTKSGDSVARSAFSLAGETIGKALASVVNLVGPKEIIVAGEGVENYDLFGSQIKESFTDHAFGAAANTEISLRSHTFYDWARGAAVSVILDIVR
jgi:predicted NBD/HSP70 family sugar kinase